MAPPAPISKTPLFPKMSIHKHIKMELVSLPDLNGVALHPPTSTPNRHPLILHESTTGQEELLGSNSPYHQPMATKLVIA